MLVGRLVQNPLERVIAATARPKLAVEHWMVHKLIYLWHHGFVPEQLDHINRDTTDNRIENLRPADTANNAQNRRLFANNKSGCKGNLACTH